MVKKLQNACVKVDKEIQSTIKSLSDTPEKQELLDLIAMKNELCDKKEILEMEVAASQDSSNLENKHTKEAIQEALKTEQLKHESELKELNLVHQQEVDGLKQKLIELEKENEDLKIPIIGSIKKSSITWRTWMIVVLTIMVVLEFISQFSSYTASRKTKRWGIALVSNEPKSICLEW